jgi:hypothetical protein
MKQFTHDEGKLPAGAPPRIWMSVQNEAVNAPANEVLQFFRSRPPSALTLPLIGADTACPRWQLYGEITPFTRMREGADVRGADDKAAGGGAGAMPVIGYLDATSFDPGTGERSPRPTRGVRNERWDRLHEFELK